MELGILALVEEHGRRRVCALLVLVEVVHIAVVVLHSRLKVALQPRSLQMELRALHRRLPGKLLLPTSRNEPLVVFLRWFNSEGHLLLEMVTLRSVENLL